LFCDVGVAEGISYEAFFPPWFFSFFFVLNMLGVWVVEAGIWA
jgi:hypothetical protein